MPVSASCPSYATFTPENRPLPILRYVLFVLVNLTVILGIWNASRRFGSAVFSEGSPLEWTQFGLLASTALLLGVKARRYPAFREVLGLLAVAAALGSIRELDAYFDRLIPLLGWKLPFFGLALPALVLVWRRRETVLRQLTVFAAHRSFAFMWCAFILAAPFGQMIGHGTFLQDLLGEDYRRPMKRIIEESAETLGYVWVLLASIDWLLDLRPVRASSARSA